MKETVFRFGPNEQLIGVLTEPTTEYNSDQMANSASRANTPRAFPIAVLLNAGIVHRVGPHRLNVQLARALAKAGYRSLRIDLSGLGDSPIRSDAVDAAQRAILDIQDAFDQLKTQTGVDRFIVIGLCSGSFHAHQIGLVDQRVVGAAFIDGYAFETPKHRRRKLRNKLRYRFLRNAIKRRMLRLKPVESLAGSGEGIEQAQFFERCQDSRIIAQEIRQLVNNGQRLHFVYTGGHPEISAAEQFNEMFDISSEQVSVEYFANSEHTFPLLDSRRELTESIVNWYRGFPELVKLHSGSSLPIHGSNDSTTHELVPCALGAPCTSPWALPPSPLAIPQN